MKQYIIALWTFFLVGFAHAVPMGEAVGFKYDQKNNSLEQPQAVTNKAQANTYSDEAKRLMDESKKLEQLRTEALERGNKMLADKLAVDRLAYDLRANQLNLQANRYLASTGDAVASKRVQVNEQNVKMAENKFQNALATYLRQTSDLSAATYMPVASSDAASAVLEPARVKERYQEISTLIGDESGGRALFLNDVFKSVIPSGRLRGGDAGRTQFAQLKPTIDRYKKMVADTSAELAKPLSDLKRAELMRNKAQAELVLATATYFERDLDVRNRDNLPTDVNNLNEARKALRAADDQLAAAEKELADALKADQGKAPITWAMRLGLQFELVKNKIAAAFLKKLKRVDWVWYEKKAKAVQGSLARLRAEIRRHETKIDPHFMEDARLEVSELKARAIRDFAAKYEEEYNEQLSLEQLKEVAPFAASFAEMLFDARTSESVALDLLEKLRDAIEKNPTSPSIQEQKAALKAGVELDDQFKGFFDVTSKIAPESSSIFWSSDSNKNDLTDFEFKFNY